MYKKRTIDSALKVELVEKYLRDEIGIREAARQAGLSGSGTESFRKWVDIYRNEGPSGLLEQKHYKHYSQEVRIAAVNDYLNGTGSLQVVAARYGLRSKHPLQNWLKEYNTHGEIKSRGSGGGSYMRKTRNTTYEERLEIVQDCLANDRNYGAAALKYQCSYQQVRNWVLRYEKMGPEGVEDRRGRRIGTLPSRTPEEELRDRIAELERKNKRLEVENALLKKVKELEMKDRYL